MVDDLIPAAAIWDPSYTADTLGKIIHCTVVTDCRLGITTGTKLAFFIAFHRLTKISYRIRKDGV